MKINLPITGRSVDFAPDANILSTTDLDSRITYANPDFINVSGYELSELLGSTHNVLRHPDMPAAAFSHMWQTLKAGRSWMGMVKNRCKNGDHYWVSAYVTPVMQNGETVEYQSVRTHPTPERVAVAEACYAALRAGPMPLWRRLPTLGLTSKIALLVSAVLGAVMAIGTVMLPQINPPAGLGLWLAGSVLSSAAIAWGLKPLNALARRAKDVGDNPLSQQIYTGRQDELGQIEFALHMLQAQVGAVVGRIGDASQRLAGHAGELVEHLQSSHNSTLHQQLETDQVAIAINEMAASVAQVASNAQQASQAADRVEHETREGYDLVIRSRTSAQHLATELVRATEVVHHLENHSSDISSVLEVIRSIAEQTNLLALNAAIEAARAGDQGRGFAVVADEVRGLAQRTQQSTSEIQQMISTLQNGARAAVQVMQQSSEYAQSSASQAQLASSALDGISLQIKRITEMSVQIASAVEEQSVVSEDINRNIAGIRSACEVTVNAGQQSQRNSGDVSALAAALRSLAQDFWQSRR